MHPTHVPSFFAQPLAAIINDVMEILETPGETDSDDGDEEHPVNKQERSWEGGGQQYNNNNDSITTKKFII